MNTVITLDKSSGFLVRSYLSKSYLCNAALLAKKSYDVETSAAVREGKIGLVQREPHHAYSSAAIVMSAFAIEAFVNELFADCEASGESNLFGFTGDQAEKLARMWCKPKPRGKRGRSRRYKEDDLQWLPPLEKYSRVLLALDLPRLNHKAEAVKAADTLMRLRNALAHYNLVVQRVGDGGEHRSFSALEKALHAYFPDHDKPQHNPMTGLGNAYIPDRVIGYAVAEWSVRTAVFFLEYFRRLLSVPEQSGGPWPTQAMLNPRPVEDEALGE